MADYRAGDRNLTIEGYVAANEFTLRSAALVATPQATQAYAYRKGRSAGFFEGAAGTPQRSTPLLSPLACPSYGAAPSPDVYHFDAHR
ncbi:hypothetical protein DIPPA_09116 [Diplonema papillatum]|nr:hypothetical protein DIPPA_09116 [Diplonema papillatum]